MTSSYLDRSGLDHVREEFTGPEVGWSIEGDVDLFGRDPDKPGIFHHFYAVIAAKRLNIHVE